MRSAQGSVTKREDGAWRVQVSCGRDPVTGKRIRKQKIVRGTKRQAEKVKQEMLVEADKRRAIGKSMTLDRFWQLFYLPDVEGRLRLSTISDYESKYRTYIRPTLGDLNLTDVTPMVIDAWVHSIDGTSKQHKAFQLLHQVMARAVRLDAIDSNPCDRLERPRKPQDYEPEVLTAEEVAEYVKVFAGTQLEAAILLCLGCALRRSELVALDWDDIQDGEVSVTHAVTSVDGVAHDDDPKSRFGMRSIAIPPSFADRLEELRSTGPVVQDSNGGRLHPDNLSKYYKRQLRKLPEGVKRIPLKNLRHTSLSLAANAGVDILAISRRAGHSGVGITSRYYLRPDKSVDRATADAMDKLLGGDSKTS